MNHSSRNTTQQNVKSCASINNFVRNLKITVGLRKPESCPDSTWRRRAKPPLPKRRPRRKLDRDPFAGDSIEWFCDRFTRQSGPIKSILAATPSRRVSRPQKKVFLNEKQKVDARGLKIENLMQSNAGLACFSVGSMCIVDAAGIHNEQN